MRTTLSNFLLLALVTFMPMKANYLDASFHKKNYRSLQNKTEIRIPPQFFWGYFRNHATLGGYGFSIVNFSDLKDNQLVLPFHNQKGLYAGAAAHGIIYGCSYQYNASAPPTPTNFVAYDTQTNELHEIGLWATEGYEMARVQDMAYNYKNETLYGIIFMQGSSKLVSFNTTTGAMKVVCSLKETIGALAVDKDGIFYGITREGILVTLDSETGNCSTIMQLPYGELYLSQSLDFDLSTGLLYWASNTSNDTSETYLIEINLKSKTTTNHGVIGAKSVLVGLSIPFAWGGLHSPSHVRELNAIPDSEGSNRVTLKWKKPATLFNGEPLTELSNYKVYRNNKFVCELNASLEDNIVEYVDDNIDVPGTYFYEVAAINSEGEGERYHASCYVGYDAPEPVHNIVIKPLSGCRGTSISWEAPQKGKNNGFFSSEGLSYSIFRNDDDSKPIAEHLTEPFFTDDKIDVLRGYYYTVVAKNKYGSSKAISEWVIVGSALRLPLKETFDDGFDQKWRVWDANNDNYSWSFNKGFSAAILGDYFFGAEYIINPTLTPNDIHTTNEWLISPPLQFGSQKKCKVTIKVRSTHNETLIVSMGNTNLVSDQIEKKKLSILPGESDENDIIKQSIYATEFNVPEGVFCIGLNLVTPIKESRQSCILIEEINIEEIDITNNNSINEITLLPYYNPIDMSVIAKGLEGSLLQLYNTSGMLILERIVPTRGIIYFPEFLKGVYICTVGKYVLKLVI